MPNSHHTKTIPKKDNANFSNKAYYQSLLESTQAVPWEMNCNTWQFTYIGPQCIDLLGFSRDKWYVKDFWINAIHPDDKAIALAFCLEQTKQNLDHEFEYRMISAQGQEVWIRDHVSVITTDNNGKRLRGFMFNITSQKKREIDSKACLTAITKQMLQYQAELKALANKRAQQIHDQTHIINQIHDSVITINFDNQITSWNKGAERLFGYQPNEVLNQLTNLLSASKNQYLFDKSLINTLRQMKNIEMESKLRKKDGSYFYSLLSLSILTDMENKPKGIICYALDISDRKATEESLMAHSAELNAVNKELKAFCYSVSHDLRTPLRSIAGFSHALLEDYGDKLDERGRNYIRRIENAAQHMGELIHNLLNLSRVTRKKMKIESVNLTQVINDIIQRNNFPSDIIHCRGKLKTPGDKALLIIALESLIDNAIKYSQDTCQPKIEIGKIHKDGNNVFFVRDNGVGFDKTYAQQMFAPFQRLHSKSSFSGAGIGLAIVQRVIDKHHGKVWAESEVDNGATFYFTVRHNQASLPLTNELL